MLRAFSLIGALVLPTAVRTAVQTLPAPLSEFYIKPGTHYHNCATLGKRKAHTLFSFSKFLSLSLVVLRCLLVHYPTPSLRHPVLSL